MPVVQCICGGRRYIVVRPPWTPRKVASRLLSASASRLLSAKAKARARNRLPEPRDDRMPLIVCPSCGRFSWADGQLADPEGRLSP